MMQAMKDKNKERKESLSMLLSALKNKAIDKREDLTPEEDNEVVLKEIKQTKETLELTPADRTDIIQECTFRISELEGIDLADVNFDDNTILVTRKGGKQSILAFGDEVRDALAAYLRQRSEIAAQPGHEKAFFLSLQRRRISPRAVENLVKKYAAVPTPLKKIGVNDTFGESGPGAELLHKYGLDAANIVATTKEFLA